MNSSCQLVIHEPMPEMRSGIENMERDEQLLEQSLVDQSAHLRFYQWSEPTVSLGYFQKPESTELPTACQELALVRRLTGGGALVHHHELTYGLTIPKGHPVTADPTQLYVIVHQALISALSQQQIEVGFREQAQPERDDAMLCFLRGDPRDVLCGEHKVIGSAQRRRKGAILQHGSLLLRRSVYAPELPGVEELSSRTVDLSQLMEEVVRQLKCEI